MGKTQTYIGLLLPLHLDGVHKRIWHWRLKQVKIILAFEY